MLQINRLISKGRVSNAWTWVFKLIPIGTPCPNKASRCDVSYDLPKTNKDHVVPNVNTTLDICGTHSLREQIMWDKKRSVPVNNI